METTMKAVVFRRHGGPEELKYVSVRTPKPARGEVLVRVKAVALNHLDSWMRRGLGVEIPMPHISGSDVCGIVAKLGEGVTGLRPGDRVVISPGQTGGQYDHLYPGQENLCPDFRIFGFQVQGGYAEYCVAEARHVIPVSSNLTYAEWAAIPLTFLTAYHMLLTRARLEPGQCVVVNGCGSGLGVAAIQLAKVAGAFVMATSRSDHKLRRARTELHADETLNTAKANMVEAVMDWTKGRGADVVFDHVGPALWDASMQSLRRGGCLVNAGATSGPAVTIPLRALYGRNITIHGCYMGTRAELNRVIELAEARRIKPVIDKVYPLAEARAAQERMENSEHFGKLVLTPDSITG